MSTDHDVSGRQLVRIAAEAALLALEQRLSRAVGGTDMAAVRTCPGRILRRHLDNSTAPGFAFGLKFAEEHPPALIENRTIQAGLLLHVLGRNLPSSEGSCLV